MFRSFGTMRWPAGLAVLHGNAMNRIVIGAVAGAAGTVALDITSYADMVVRGRGASNLAAELVRRLAEKVGLDALSERDEAADAKTKNRRTALGALAGYMVGITVGATYGATRPLFANLPLFAKAVIVGGLAMAASDVPLTKLGLTDPRQWGTVGWLSDIIPHVAYGLVTAAVTDSFATQA
jgi:hypothetical protein